MTMKMETINSSPIKFGNPKEKKIPWTGIYVYYLTNFGIIPITSSNVFNHKFL